MNALYNTLRLNWTVEHVRGLNWTKLMIYFLICDCAMAQRQFVLARDLQQSAWPRLRVGETFFVFANNERRRTKTISKAITLKRIAGQLRKLLLLSAIIKLIFLWTLLSMFGMPNGDSVVSCRQSSVSVPVSDHKSLTSRQICRAALETAPSYGPVNTFSVRLSVCVPVCVWALLWSCPKLFLGSLNQQQQLQFQLTSLMTKTMRC